MSEILRQKNESTGEHTVSNQESQKHQERLHEHHEKAAEKAPSTNHEAQKARREIKEAISGHEAHQPQSEKRQHKIHNTKSDKNRSFNTTMHHVRNQLSASEKTFSKIIHNPSMEKASEIASATVARPSGIAGATIAAIIGLLIVYGIAKFAGFELSGSEMPLLLMVGFIMGLIIEWLYKSIKSLIGRRSNES